MKLMILFILGLLLAHSEAQKSLNKRSLDLIKTSEGWKACAYNDVAGILTIGYGHKVKSGERYKIGTCISETEGADLLKNDVSTASRCIDRIVKVDLNDNQYGALSSWAYNVGCGNVQSSTLVRLLNQGDKASVCSELKRWNKAGGKVVQGLVVRRQAECDLFNS